MKFNDPEDECSVLVASDAIGMGLNLWVCQVNCNSYLYKCLSIRAVMFTCSDEWLTLETSALSKVYSPWRRVNARNVCLETLNSGQFTFINLVLVRKSNYQDCDPPHWRSTRVSVEFIPFIYLNPFTPISDQDRISPYNINTISSRQVMRIKKNIN